MSTAAGSSAPPPPPGGGDDPRKNFPGHKSPGKWTDGDGSSLNKAAWMIGADRNRARHFVVHRRTEVIKWVRCNLREAVMDQNTGLDVYDVTTGRRVRFAFKGAQNPSPYEAFSEQLWSVVLEERARVERHEDVGGEDLTEDADEEYENSGDRIFDVGFTRTSPASSASVRSPMSSPRGRVASPTAGPRTRTRKGQDPLSPAGRGSGGSRGHGYGGPASSPRGRGSSGLQSSPRGRGSDRHDSSPHGRESFGSPVSGRGRGRGRGGRGRGSSSGAGSPGAGSPGTGGISK